jgi:hypothetical protein
MKFRLTLLVCAVLAIAIALPAAGAPSLSDIARKASKALKVAKKANRGQKAANNEAAGAQATADDALNRANTALTGPRVQTFSQERAAPPFDFAEFSITCPDGMLPVGISMGNGALDPVFAGPGGQTAIGSLFNSSDTTTYSGHMYVQCVDGRFLTGATVARTTRGEALDDMAEAERAKLREAR